MEKVTQTTLDDLAKHPDITTPEGMEAAIKIIRQEEFNRFCNLMEQFLFQIKDDVMRESLEQALVSMRFINAE